jgi:hypothetical protein
MTTVYLGGAKNTNCWHARKGDLQRAFHLDVPMVPSSTYGADASDECLSCDGFFLGETICFGNLKFIAD